MKKKWLSMRKYCKQLLPVLLTVLTIILIIQQLFLADYILSIVHATLPVIMGCVIAFLFQPIIDQLHKRFSYKTAVCIVYLGFFCMLLVLILILIPILYGQLMEVLEYLPSSISKLQKFIQPIIGDQNIISEYQQTYLKEGSSMVIQTIQNTLQTFATYGIAYITAFFISTDINFWKRTIMKLIPSAKNLSTFYLTMSTIIYQYLKGTMFDLLFITVSTSFILALFQFPNWLFYAILLAFLNLFPYIGATIGLVVIAFAGMLHFDNFPWITFACVWILQQIEANFVQPMIFNKMMNVRPLLNFAFLFIGEALFGIPGVILSPILAAISQIAFRSWLHARSKQTVGNWNEIWVDFDLAIEVEKKNYDVS